MLTVTKDELDSARGVRLREIEAMQDYVNDLSQKIEAESDRSLPISDSYSISIHKFRFGAIERIQKRIEAMQPNIVAVHLYGIDFEQYCFHHMSGFNSSTSFVRVHIQHNMHFAVRKESVSMHQDSPNLLTKVQKTTYAEYELRLVNLLLSGGRSLEIGLYYDDDVNIVYYYPIK